MERIDMVEGLRKRANVSYEEAKAALEANNWDMLDALVYLEGQGKVHEPAAASYSTRQEQQAPPQPAEKGAFTRAIHNLMAFFDKVIEKGTQNSFVISKDDKRIVGMPVLLFVILFLFCFYITIPLLILAVLFGYKIRFEGPESKGANVVLGKVTQTVENVKNDLTKEEPETVNGSEQV